VLGRIFERTDDGETDPVESDTGTTLNSGWG
jgi:hypothetical protein